MEADDMKKCPNCGEPLPGIHVRKPTAKAPKLKNIKDNLKGIKALFKKPDKKTDKCDTCIYKISSVNNTDDDRRNEPL
jgi:ribosomal protein L34E